MKYASQLMERHPENPLISTKEHPEYFQIFNPSPAMHDGQTILLVSVLPLKDSRLGLTKVARSDDGIHFTLEQESFIDLQHLGEPYNQMYHFIDNRITRIDDTWYICTPVGSPGKFAGSGPVTIMGKTKDFRSYEFIDVVALPPQRGSSLFPEKINGMYARLDRPGAGENTAGSIWLSTSPDLIHWGSCYPVMAPGQPGRWASRKIGPTPPIKTPQGWLVIIHGVITPLGVGRYYLGAMMLDLEDPRKVIGCTASPLLQPEADYEIRGNIVDSAVFACGALADFDKDELRLYYGAGDSSVCLATGCLSDIIDCCLNYR